MSLHDNRKTLNGVVISDKMAKTVTVAIIRKVKHPHVGKYLTRTTKLMAHDEKEEAKPGDRVMIKEVRPISKNKRWLVVEILKKSAEVKALDLGDGSEPK
jgi:small subunit ribosomal protein S17